MTSKWPLVTNNSCIPLPISHYIQLLSKSITMCDRGSQPSKMLVNISWWTFHFHISLKGHWTIFSNFFWLNCIVLFKVTDYLLRSITKNIHESYNMHFFVENVLNGNETNLNSHCHFNMVPLDQNIKIHSFFVDCSSV